ncbi:unnamed protein product [Arctogadus glacialis]
MNTSHEPDRHVEFVRSSRVLLASILYDHELMLTSFRAQYKIPDREYRSLAAKENKLEALLDLVQNKGESACKVFISLLRKNLEVKETFPRLTELDFSPLDATSSPPPPGPQSPKSTQRAGPSRGSRARRPEKTKGLTRKPKGVFSLKGYLQQVSELIQRKNSHFFRTKIQTKDQTWSVVVFQTEQREEFIKLEKNKRLVVLEGLAKGRKGCVLFKESSRFKSTQTSTPSPPYDPQPPLETVTMEILGVHLKEKFSCPRDHLLEDLPPSQYVDCGLCDMKYGKAALKRVLSGKVFVRDRESDLELTDDHVRNLLKEAMDEGCDTIDKLEIALKEVCFLKVTLSNNIVISVSRASPDASQCRATHIVC